MVSPRFVCRMALGSLAAVCLLGLSALQAAPPAPIGTLPTEAGQVHYRFTKPGLNGSTVFTWAQGGAVFRQDLRGGNSTETVIGQGSGLYSLNSYSQTAQRAEVKPTDVWLNHMEMPHVTPASGAGKVVGTGTVLGKQCEIRKLHTMRIWFWQGLPLRMERAANPRLKMRPLQLVATRLDTQFAPKPELFELPAGYKVTTFPGRPSSRIPWTTLTAMGLVGLLLFTGVSAWMVERGFARQAPSP